MISLGRVKQYCKNYTEIENYDKAIADKTEMWACHHRMENSNNSIQNNVEDTATVINNINTNPNDAKVQLLLKIEDLKAEKQRWIDEQTDTSFVYKTLQDREELYALAALRYNGRIKALENALSKMN